jgi:hypothetical protein
MSFHGLRSGFRWRGLRLARRHPNRESEGIWDNPTPVVRPDLRRDMVGIPKTAGPQERERERCGAPTGNIFTTGGPQSLVGNPVPRDESELQPSARFLRK